MHDCGRKFRVTSRSMLQGSPRFAALLALALTACGEDPERAAERADDEEGEQSNDELDAGPDARAREPRDAALPIDPSVQDSSAWADARADASPGDAAAGQDARAPAPPFTPALQIPLRVHRGDSGLSGAQLASVLEEMNAIWWTQAAICFEIEIVKNDEPRRDGFDLWFHRKTLGCNTTANGVFCGDHDVHSLDAPSLGRADDAAWNVRQAPARTAAHELGHGLNLQHYNGFADSNDSLMSSGRQGFKLHASELETARRRAQSKGAANSVPCAKVPVVD
jgi:hypothetical protein